MRNSIKLSSLFWLVWFRRKFLPNNIAWFSFAWKSSELLTMWLQKMRLKHIHGVPSALLVVFYILPIARLAKSSDTHSRFISASAFFHIGMVVRFSALSAFGVTNDAKVREYSIYQNVWCQHNRRIIFFVVRSKCHLIGSAFKEPAWTIQIASNSLQWGKTPSIRKICSNHHTLNLAKLLSMRCQLQQQQRTSFISNMPLYVKCWFVDVVIHLIIVIKCALFISRLQQQSEYHHAHCKLLVDTLERVQSHWCT